VACVALTWLSTPRAALAFSLDTAAKVAITNGSQVDVQTAINAAAVTIGWTVTIPAGSFTWASTVTVSKPIRLRGAGASLTTISGGASPKLTIIKQPAAVVWVSDLSFIANGDEGIEVVGPWTARPFIVSDCVFNVSGGRAFRVMTNGGLIYNCTFNGEFGFNDEAIQDKQPSDTQSWNAPDTIGTNDTTGERNLYIEDCTFNSMPLQGMDFDDASRVVVRHSKFMNSAITSHGADTSAVGLRHFEIYDNEFRYTFAGNDPNAKDVGYFMFIRGGTGVITDNVIDNIISTEWGNKTEIQLTVQSISRVGQIACQTTYPALRQVGQSFDGSSYFTDPIRIWNNTGTGNYIDPDISQYEPDECGNNQKIEDYIQANRDYVVSARPGYTKYTYPHPLRSGTSSRPTPPTNVRIVRGGN
jgi:hypothetical protein